MKYDDRLYGEWELPPFLKRLIHTKEMIRLRNITQSILPNDLIVFGPVNSRFQHCLGAAYLATKVLENNPHLATDYQVLLPVSLLLHDAGNPPLSHLGEVFLRLVAHEDGESFLAHILDGSETETVLRELGLWIPQVVNMVTGRLKPISDVVNGTLDLDNLDNVGRFASTVNLQVEKFDAVQIASCFRLSNSRLGFDEWTLLDSCLFEVQKWQNARAAVYGKVYSQPQLNISAMIYRAMEFAYCEDRLPKHFFYYNDSEAIQYLLGCCGPETAYLVDRAVRWDWYQQVFLDATWHAKPPEKLEKLVSDWTARKKLADLIASRLGIPQEKVCVRIFEGKEKRKVCLPFVSSTGGEARYFFQESDDVPIHRMAVYVPEEFTDKRDAIKEIMRAETK